MGREAFGEQQLYLIDEPVEGKGGHGHEKAHDKTQDKRELPIRDVFLAPYQDFLPHSSAISSK